MSKHAALDTFGRSGNPAFGNRFDADAQFSDLPVDQKMTLAGTVNKTGILLLLCFTTATLTWNYPSPILMGVGIIGGLIAALFTIFKPTNASITAPGYAHFRMTVTGSSISLNRIPIDILLFQTAYDFLLLFFSQRLNFAFDGLTFIQSILPQK